MSEFRDCPLCHGASTVDPDPNCPVCHGEGETIAGLPVVTDASLPPGIVELRDGFGSVIWRFGEPGATKE